jgi:hypothetical protein
VCRSTSSTLLRSSTRLLAPSAASSKFVPLSLSREGVIYLNQVEPFRAVARTPDTTSGPENRAGGTFAATGASRRAAEGFRFARGAPRYLS